MDIAIIEELAPLLGYPAVMILVICLRYLQKILTKNDSEHSLMRNGLLLLYRHSMFSLAKKALKQGYRTESETIEIVSIYEHYKALGGNSIADMYYQDFMNLELKEGLVPSERVRKFYHGPIN